MGRRFRGPSLTTLRLGRGTSCGEQQVGEGLGLRYVAPRIWRSGSGQVESCSACCTRCECLELNRSFTKPECGEVQKVLGGQPRLLVVQPHCKAESERRT